MKVISLPQDILAGKENLTDGIFFHNYHSLKDEFRGRSILQTNAISLVISGEKTMTFADKTITIRDDEFHFLSAGNCIASIHLSGKEIFRSILIFFDHKVLTDFYLKHSELIARVSKKIKITREPYVPFKKDEFVWNFIASLGLLFRKGLAISPAMKRVKFEELMLHLLENSPQTVLSFQSAEKRAFGDFEIQKAVEENVATPITVEELAFLCNISSSTFKRRFAGIYKTSPNRWFLKKRIEMAKALLQHHDTRPSDVYHKVGYENHSSFSQSFKQVVGLTPRDFQTKQLTARR